MDEKKAATLEQLLESARQSEALTMQVAQAAQAEMAGKQGKLTGTAGQVVGFDANGQAVAQEVPVEGMTQEQADGRYLKLSGGEVNNGFNAFASAPDPYYGQVGAEISLNNGFVQLIAMDEPGDSYVSFRLNRNSFGLSIRGRDVISMPASGGGVFIKSLADPTVDTMPATKKYVDDEIAALEARIAALEAKLIDGTTSCPLTPTPMT